MRRRAHRAGRRCIRELGDDANLELPAVTGHSLCAGRRYGRQGISDNNDLSRGIEQAQQAISNYYIFGYYTTNADPNGQLSTYPDITQWKPGGRLQLDYHQGYYAEKAFSKFNDVDRERQLEDALILEDPITDLTIAMEVDYFQLNRAQDALRSHRGQDSGPGAGVGQAWRGGTLADRLCGRDQRFGGRNGADFSNVRGQCESRLLLTRRRRSLPSGPSNTTPDLRCCPANT